MSSGVLYIFCTFNTNRPAEYSSKYRVLSGPLFQTLNKQKVVFKLRNISNILKYSN